MKTLKSKLVMLAVLMVGAVAMSFAMANDNTEVKNSKVKTENQMTQYFVTGKTTSHYLVSTSPEDALDCEGPANEPCRIASSADATGGQIAISDVEDTDQTQVLSWTESLP